MNSTMMHGSMNIKFNRLSSWNFRNVYVSVYLRRGPAAGYSEFSNSPAHYIKTGVLLTIHVATAN